MQTLTNIELLEQKFKGSFLLYQNSLKQARIVEQRIKEQYKNSLLAPKEAIELLKFWIDDAEKREQNYNRMIDRCLDDQMSELTEWDLEEWAKEAYSQITDR